MRTNNISIYYSNKSQTLEDLDCPPEGRLTTTRLLSNGGFFRVYAAIISPESEESENYLTLSYRQAKRISKAITNIVEAFEEELR